ncbi:MAG TPA: AI-2E family transporter [Bryobacterales bacterium]|nr:AI-2E family transporter [Bryobacterales bacterium]
MAVLDTFPNLQLGSNTSQRVIAWGVVLAVCYLAQPVVITFFCSLLFAFLLEPPVGWLVRLRLPRALAALIVCLLALGLLGVVGGLFYSRSAGFVDELPRYENTIKDIVYRVSQRMENLQDTFMRFMPPERSPKNQQGQVVEQPRRSSRRAAPPPPPQPPPVQEVRLKDDTSFITKYVFPQLRAFYEFLLFASFIPFLVYFMLSWKEHMRHGFVNLFHLENRQVVHNTLNGIGVMVRGFLVGNFLLAILLAAASAVIFWSLRIPFPFMMGTLSGLLSVIPYVGLPLAVIPPVFAALGVFHSLSSYILIMGIVGALHLFALNVLYPKLVGSRVHLNPLAVTVAILTWAWMWGAIGLLMAIPITASLKAVCDNVPALRSWGELLGD